MKEIYLLSIMICLVLAFTDQDWEYVILVVFTNSTDGDWKTLDLDKVQQ